MRGRFLRRAAPVLVAACALGAASGGALAAVEPDARAIVPESRSLRRQGTQISQALLEAEIEVARREGDGAREAQLLHQLAAVLIELGQFESALRAGDQVIDLARGVGDPALEGWGLGARGDALFFLGDYAGAGREFEGMLERMRQAEDPFGEANALKNLGIIDKYVGDYEGAIARLEIARDALREQGTEIELASTLESLGGAYIRMGDGPRAFDAFQEALEMARRTEDRRLIQQTQIRMAILFLESDLPERALAPLDEALGIIRDLDLPVQELWALYAKAGALSMLGRLDEAIETQEHGLEIAGRQDSRLVTAGTLHGLGGLYATFDGHRALDHLEEAASILRDLGLPPGWYLFWDMARAHRTLGELDRAVELYLRSIESMESQRGRIVSPRFRTSFLGRHQKVYQELIDVLFQRGRDAPDDDDRARAFQALERGKARTLVEGIVEARVDVGWPLDPDLAERREALEARIASLNSTLIRSTTAREERSRLLGEIEGAEEDLQILIDEIRRRNKRYALVRYPEPLSIAGVQRLLEAGTALLAYSETGEALYAFLVTADDVQARRLEGSPDVVAQRVRNYVELLAEDGGVGWYEVGRRLYDELVQPILAGLPDGTRNLVVIPDGVLHFLPFETLPTGTGTDGEPGYLLEGFSVSYAPSATVLAQLEDTRAARERGDLLMFANPLRPGTGGHGEASRTRALFEDEGLQIPPIPYSAEEASALRRLATAGSEFYVGAAASEERVKSIPLDRFRVIHFATHGLISQRHPARSALLLAPGSEGREDGFLQAREIYSMRLASDLVVLSACRTARGGVLAGEGVRGLAQAFLHAGAQAVVASLWDVDDDRTARLMELFYENLAKGSTVAEALRGAKLAMIAEAGSAEPRLWAPFVVIGAAQAGIALTPRPAWRGWLPWGGAGLALLLLVSLPMLRRRTNRGMPSPSNTRMARSSTHP